MNEFTKEELEKLLVAVTETKFAECWPMRDKIQSLIDNYCEHEISYAGFIEVGMCKHCGKTE